MDVVDGISCGRRFNTKDIRLTLMHARTYPIGSADLAVGHKRQKESREKQIREITSYTMTNPT